MHTSTKEMNNLSELCLFLFLSTFSGFKAAEYSLKSIEARKTWGQITS